MKIKRILKEKVFNQEANYYSKRIYLNLLLNQGISRSAAGLNRKIDSNLPFSWEFSGFSQNGEDGIIEFLLSNLINSNRYFVEIGAGNGLENNTAYLAHVKKFAGLQIEGNKNYYEEALLTKAWLTDLVCLFVNESGIEGILKKILFKDADVFSLDIDGMDYYIMKLLLENGLSPKICVVEYNSGFGPEKSITIPFKSDFNMFETKHPYLYYGVSLNGWKTLFKKYDYHFLTVESNGVNAFFIHKSEFRDLNFSEVSSLSFAENRHQLRYFGGGHTVQYEKIKDMPFFEIS